MFIEPVARFRSPFKTKFGIPRQAGLVLALKGRIVLEPGFRAAEAMRGLEGFDYIWLIWGFSGNKPRPVTEATDPVASAGSATGQDWHPSVAEPADSVAEPVEAHRVSAESPRRLVSQVKPLAQRQERETFQATVRPPRLGGNERIGVFASRSPFRPNGLGLSSVRIESIEYDAKDQNGKPLGPVINVLGADLMDGTPIYDIKPYVTYADSHPEAASGFVDDKEWRPLKVVFAGSVTEPVEVTIPDWKKSDIAALKEVLAQDPRPRYQNNPDKVYGMIFNGMDIRFKVNGDVLTVIEVKPV